MSPTDRKPESEIPPSGPIDYTKYTLAQLRDAQAWIDADKYPERAKRLEAELEERLAGAPPVPDVPLVERLEPATARRRLAAFLIDVVLVSAGATALDNLIAVPVPRPILPLAIFVLQTLYFVSLAATQAATVGQRALGLRVVDGDETEVSAKPLFVRWAVLGLLLFFPWTEVFVAALGWVPSLAENAFAGARYGLLLFSALHVRTAGGRLLHDHVAGTNVRRVHRRAAIDDDAASEAPAVAPPLGRLGVALVCVLLGVAATVAVNLRMDGGLHLTEQARAPLRETQPFDATMENIVAEALGLRVRVTVTEATRWDSRTPGEVRRTLTVKTWIPLVRWNDETRQRVLGVVVPDIRVIPGYYDEGWVELWSGGYVFTTSWGVQLTLPDAPS